MQVMGLEGTNLLIAVLAGILAVVLILRALIGRRDQGGAPAENRTPAIRSADTPNSELVAVIAAAVAAASGMAPGSFRIAGIEPAQFGSSGFNTPVWGHVDRLGRASFKA